MALLSVWKLSFEAFLLVLFSRVCLFVPSDPGQCYSWDIFQHGHLLGNKLRMIENIGPFTCIRECLLRKSCKSIDYLQYYKACEINFDNTSKDNPLEQKLLPWRHLEKSDMYKLLDVSPCNDTVCGVNERCEVLANDSVSCSITECSPLVEEEFHLKNKSKSVMMIGSRIQYNCTSNAALKIVRYCQPTGLWKDLEDSPNACSDQSAFPNLLDW